jgi:tRNA G10  N-methylase Trm11
MRLANIHPFPARMASELALGKTDELQLGATVLDPMAGSGTVLQAASRHGHRCIGLDVDPLAVLMAKVATSRLNEKRFDCLLDRLIDQAQRIDLRSARLPWLDQETESFIQYWFAEDQRRALGRLAYVLHANRSFSDNSAEANAIRLMLSKVIITKDRGASLARDVSHSRPHRVADENNFDVFTEIQKSAVRLKGRLSEAKVGMRAVVRRGDARSLPWIRDASIDMIMTSPPYLNAIDYMRGHRLSLVWLGYGLSHLRNIRSNSIGAERGPDANSLIEEAQKVRNALGKIKNLPSRDQGMIDRYSLDLVLMAKQASRVLKRSGQAVFVVGNSRLRDVFVSNAHGLEMAAEIAGLKLIEESERRLPAGSRYLPMPADKKSSLGRRMRTETVLTFVHGKGNAA